MDISKYRSQSKPFSIELKEGEKLSGKYLANALNGAALEELERRGREQESDEARLTTTTIYESYVDHLVLVLESLEITDGNKKIPFDSDEEKRAALRLFTLDDVALIVRGVNETVAAPLEKTGIDSSDGLPPKE